MRVKCEGGMLDGQVLDKAEPEPTIHQNGLAVLKVHIPYPKRRGERVVNRLLTWTEDYHLHHTEAGPVYRCASPFNDKEIIVGGEPVARSEGGAFEVWADRAGRLHARPRVEEVDERGAPAPPVRVSGYVPQTPEDEAALGEIVAAAVRRMERES